MMDKIGWTEPLDSERGVLEIVMVPSCRRALSVPAVDGMRQRVDIFMGARGFVGGRNHYDRCAFEGQRRGRRVRGFWIWRAKRSGGIAGTRTT